MIMMADPMPLPSYEQFMIDNLRTAVLLFDEDLRLVAMNPAAESLLEASENQVLGLGIGQLFADARRGGGRLANAVHEGQPLIERDMVVQLNGGRSILVDCTVTPLKEPVQPDGILMELIPREHHKRITREQQLLDLNDTARSLVRRVAHEIRNPLGGLRGAAQLLEREIVDDGLREYTSVIIREADRLQNLMDRMLGPRTPPKMRPVNIHEITERVRTLIQAAAPAGVSVEREYDPSVPEVQGDPEMLIQATLNVARNAVQVLKEQGGQVLLRTRVLRQFTIRHTRHRHVVCIDVVDNGPGVPEELRESIFYPMVTGREEGTGLGLSIAQSLIGRHGGLIECSGGPEETIFSILLPVEKA